MKNVVVTLSRLITHAKKVIHSDAMTNDRAVELVKHRAPGLMLRKDFKKFEGTPAISMKNENDFLQALKDHCNTHQHFPFGCDSCSVVTKFYHACREALADNDLKDNMLLITADSLYRVTDATKDFKDKFVSYSPKIMFGVDVLIDVPQYVFIYIASTSVQPSGSYQQATRCRNTKQLYYFGEVCQRDAFDESLEDVKACVAEAAQTSKLHLHRRAQPNPGCQQYIFEPLLL
jgi:hypothetical protein